ncbi:MAG: indole-3-glycerol phosphate synthase TrpC [Chloroflexota bacterium]
MVPESKTTGTVLDRIVAAKAERVRQAQHRRPLDKLRGALESAPARASFLQAVTRPSINVITEMKRASASAGALAEDLDPAGVARAFIESGASAISVLTEQDYFSGTLDDLRAVKEVAGPHGVPVLEKDFVFSEYQVYEAAVNGADAVLLIIAILEQDQYAELLRLARCLGLDALVEVFTPKELELALSEDPDIIGINNRNLKTLQTDLATFERLAPLVPRDKALVAESGMKNADDVRRMRDAGAQAVLVGESLMRAGGDVSDLIRELTGRGEQSHG